MALQTFYSMSDFLFKPSPTHTHTSPLFITIGKSSSFNPSSNSNVKAEYRQIGKIRVIRSCRGEKKWYRWIEKKESNVGLIPTCKRLLVATSYFPNGLYHQIYFLQFRRCHSSCRERRDRVVTSNNTANATRDWAKFLFCKSTWWADFNVSFTLCYYSRFHQTFFP